MHLLGLRVLLSFVVMLVVGMAGHMVHAQPSSESLDVLRRELERVLTDGGTPGASVAVVRQGQPPWVAGLGTADVASRRPANADTLFRLGSVSKQFVGLAILLLVERGQLSLEDQVRRLVPEVRFENRWESTDPVRVVHLLEHTTGWDDIHLREYAKDGSRMPLREALEFGSSSRVSRWRPATRMAYCNSGPAVAAYIVERLTGQRFEEFVAQNLFAPIGMNSATYFQPERGIDATLYRGDGTPAPYWHMLYRPSGAINASARDMAAYLQLMLARGQSGQARIVEPSTFERMEFPRTTWAARAGLKIGYGLTTAALIRDGFVWHGHSGDVMGGISELWYVPDLGIGYFTSINSGNGFVSFRLGLAIRGYLTRGRPQPGIPPAAEIPAQARVFDGWYEPVVPSMQFSYFFDRLLGVGRLRFDGDRLVYRSLNARRTYVPVDGLQFRRVYESAEDPVPTLALLETDEGRFIQMGTETEPFRWIPFWLVALELLLVMFVLACVLAVIVYAPFWIVGGLRRGSVLRRERVLHVFPFLSVMSLVATALLFATASDDPTDRLGNPTAWSVGVWLATLLFGAATVASAVIIWRTPPLVARATARTFAIVVTAALLMASGCLAYWGIIGLRTWA